MKIPKRTERCLDSLPWNEGMDTIKLDRIELQLVSDGTVNKKPCNLPSGDSTDDWPLLYGSTHHRERTGISVLLWSGKSLAQTIESTWTLAKCCIRTITCMGTVHSPLLCPCWSTRWDTALRYAALRILLVTFGYWCVQNRSQMSVMHSTKI